MGKIQADVEEAKRGDLVEHDVESSTTHSISPGANIDLSAGQQLERGLKSRHIQPLAQDSSLDRESFCPQSDRRHCSWRTSPCAS
nr:hypothetical protein CFP56_13157 [Quercus suber]